MKFTVLAGAVAFFCSTVQAEAEPEPQRLSLSFATFQPITIETLGPPKTLTLRPSLITDLPPFTIIRTSSTCTPSTVVKVETVVSTLTLKPSVGVTTVTVVNASTLYVTLPPVTVTSTTAVIRTAVVTVTIPCPSSTTDPCPEPCAVTKTYEDCKIDEKCVPTVSTTTTGCRCPVASCTSIKEVSTCYTCPPLGIKTVGCSTAVPSSTRF